MSIAKVLSGATWPSSPSRMDIGGGVFAIPLPSARMAPIPDADADLRIASSTSSMDWKRQEGCFSKHFITRTSISRGNSISGRSDRIGGGGSFICLKMTSIESLATKGGRPTSMW